MSHPLAFTLVAVMSGLAFVSAAVPPRPRARQAGVVTGILPPGPLDAITDVPGVRVGHATMIAGDGIRTGVTVIVPHPGNVFQEKVPAAVFVANGFGKLTGVTQLRELGTLETPIALTGTLSTWKVADALAEWVLAQPGNAEVHSLTPVVGECNDGPLNDIQALAVTEEHARAALNSAHDGPVEQGSVGAGTGMTCFGFKGGVGSSSRRIMLDRRDHHLGVLVLTNFGNAGDLVIPDGRRPSPRMAEPLRKAQEQGSVIIVIATDVPLEHRQLDRIARRAGAGLARLGSFWGHGSGDIAIAFTTANIVKHGGMADLREMRVLNEDRIDLLFRAAAEATQEAVLNAMLSADRFVGRAGTVRVSLADVLRSSKTGLEMP
jgi:D-aminopeptidase